MTEPTPTPTKKQYEYALKMNIYCKKHKAMVCNFMAKADIEEKGYCEHLYAIDEKGLKIIPLDDLPPLDKEEKKQLELMMKGVKVYS
jgi:hypothetical protein